jgi:hypothetical protein
VFDFQQEYEISPLHSTYTISGALSVGEGVISAKVDLWLGHEVDV